MSDREPRNFAKQMMADHKHDSGKLSGRIELICGPMFAGKSTMLIERLAAAKGQSNRVIACKPARDTRYAADRIVTHDGADILAERIAGSSDLLMAAQSADVVGIDEFHFFEMRLVETCEALDNAGKRVICAGVDLDHRGQMFDVMNAIMQRAGDVVRLTSTCSVCGQVATFTQRMVKGDDRIVVGGTGDYEPRCENCFVRDAS